jgi:hypothetical protein
MHQMRPRLPHPSAAGIGFASQCPAKYSVNRESRRPRTRSRARSAEALAKEGSFALPIQAKEDSLDRFVRATAGALGELPNIPGPAWMFFITADERRYGIPVWKCKSRRHLQQSRSMPWSDRVLAVTECLAPNPGGHRGPPLRFSQRFCRHCEKQAKPVTKQSHSGIEIAASLRSSR